jgi:hypothetical protein
MKKTILFAFVLLSISVFSQKVNVGFYYQMDAPQKHYMPYMSNNHGMGMQIGFKPTTLFK